MERLDFTENTAYNQIEACIHLNRYATARPFCEGAVILDAACGQGYGSYLMKTWGAKEVVGVDIDRETVEQASRLFQQDGLRYMQHTVEQLPFGDASFDMVVSFETIEHVDDPAAFLREIRRVLKPGGTVLISCPNDNYYYENGCAQNPFHKREYTYFQFRELAEKHLGDDADYYFAFALDGFINLPADKLTEPEKDELPGPLGLLDYESCSHALCVPSAQHLNMWNANYYIGVWGPRKSFYRISSVAAPRAWFSPQYAWLQQQLETERMANKRLTALLELTKQERGALSWKIRSAFSNRAKRFLGKAVRKLKKISQKAAGRLGSAVKTVLDKVKQPLKRMLED